MRVLILSDVHSNLAALEAVLRDAESRGRIDAVWCLGDTVGYGPQPRECIARLRELGAVAVAGNHDRAATGQMGTEEFNADAAAAAHWTRGQLSEGERSYLDGLPEVAYAGTGAGARDAGPETAEFTLVHGTLRWPIWEYLYSHEAALAHLERQRSPFGLVGHTHVPMLAVEDERSEQGCEMYYLEDGVRLSLPKAAEGGRTDARPSGRKLVINPGGVGQPRDGDPRAAYALYDSGEQVLAVHRVEYEIAVTQRLMEAADLPRWLSERLAVGR